MIIQADTREPTEDLRRIFDSHIRGNPVLSQELDVIYKVIPNRGDYILENSGTEMIIERKEMHDFASCEKDDLKNKLMLMRRDFEHSALLIEGSYILKDGDICLWRGRELVRSMSYKAYSSFLISQQEMGTHIYQTFGLNETVKRLLYILEYLPKMGLSTTRKADSGKDIFKSIPGVGPTKLTGLMEKYKNPVEALKNYEEWVSPRGKTRLETW